MTTDWSSYTLVLQTGVSIIVAYLVDTAIIAITDFAGGLEAIKKHIGTGRGATETGRWCAVFGAAPGQICRMSNRVCCGLGNSVACAAVAGIAIGLRPAAGVGAGLSLATTAMVAAVAAAVLAFILTVIAAVVMSSAMSAAMIFAVMADLTDVVAPMVPTVQT